MSRGRRLLISWLAALAGFALLGMPAADWWLGVDEISAVQRISSNWLRELVAYLMPIATAVSFGLLTWNSLRPTLVPQERAGEAPATRTKNKVTLVDLELPEHEELEDWNGLEGESVVTHDVPDTIGTIPISSSRIARFPSDQNLGRIYLRSPKNVWKGEQWTNRFGDAVGRVSIPDGYQVQLWSSQIDPNAEGWGGLEADLTFLHDIPTDMFDSLSVRRLPKRQAFMLQRIQDLSELIVDGTVDDETINPENLKQIPELKSLNVDYSDITERGFSDLLDFMIHLEYLFVRGTSFNDRNARDLSQTRLKLLAAEGTMVTDDGLRALMKLPNLETLYADRTQVTDSGIAALLDHPTLKELSLFDTVVSDKGFTGVTNASSIERLTLSSTRVTGERFSFDAFPKLKHLSLPTTFNEQCLEGVAELPDLTGLFLFAPLSSQGSRYLRRANNLEVLQIWDGPPALSDIVGLLEALPDLEYFSFDHARERYSGRKSISALLERLRKVVS